MSYKTALTPREIEVAELLVQGLSYLEMARRLIIGRNTIMTHVLHIYQKLGLSNRYELMALRIKELEDEIKELKSKRT